MSSAYTDGALSEEGLDTLVALPDIGSRIRDGLGAPYTGGGEVLLVSIMADDSLSISMANNEAAVCAGPNLILDALGELDQGADALVHTRYLHGNVLNAYRPNSEALRMGEENYRADQDNTPLFDQSVVLLGTVFTKAEALAREGVSVRTFSLIVTDGEDTCSQRADRDVSWLVQDLALGGNHIVAGMGISNGRTDFRAVFRGMGIPENWVMTAASTTADIKSKFQTVADAVALAASSETGFRELTEGPPQSSDLQPPPE